MFSVGCISGRQNAARRAISCGPRTKSEIVHNAACTILLSQRLSNTSVLLAYRQMKLVFVPSSVVIITRFKILALCDNRSNTAGS